MKRFITLFFVSFVNLSQTFKLNGKPNILLVMKTQQLGKNEIVEHDFTTNLTIKTSFPLSLHKLNSSHIFCNLFHFIHFDDMNFLGIYGYLYPKSPIPHLGKHGK